MGWDADEIMYTFYNFEHVFLLQLNSKFSVYWDKDFPEFLSPIRGNLKSSILKFVEPFYFTKCSEF